VGREKQGDRGRVLTEVVVVGRRGKKGGGRGEWNRGGWTEREYGGKKGKRLGGGLRYDGRSGIAEMTWRG